MKIYIGNNPTETHIMQQQLFAEGVQCEVRGEGVFGLRGEVPFDESSLPYIWLHDVSQEAKAKTIVLAVQQQENNCDQTSWRCPECNELNEAQFGACWNCQRLAAES